MYEGKVIKHFGFIIPYEKNNEVDSRAEGDLYNCIVFCVGNENEVHDDFYHEMNLDRYDIILE